MRYVLLCTVLVLVQLLFSNFAVAAEANPVETASGAVEAAAEPAPTPTPPRAPWLQPEVLKAAVGIGLTEEQMPGFRAAVTDLVNNRTKAINRVMRGNNVSNLKRKLRVANSRQFKKMDKSMAALLTDAQYPKYEVYRDLLGQEMQLATRRRSGGNSDSMGVANAALNGFSDSN